MSATTTQPRHRDQFPILADSDVSGQPLDGRSAARRQGRARNLLGRMGGERSRSVGSVAAADRRDRRRHRRAHRRAGAAASFSGRTFRCCRRRSQRASTSRDARNEVVYEALQFPSLTYVWREWERYGARVRVVDSDDGRTIPTRAHHRRDHRDARRSRCSRTPTTSPARSPTCARSRRTAARSARLLCVDAYQTTGVYPYDVTAWDLDIVTGGSHKWLLRRSRLRLDLRQARVARATPSGRDRLDGARAAIQF